MAKKSSASAVPPIVVNQCTIDRVKTFKLLGIVFNSKLTWDDHVLYILAKVSKRLYYIRQLVKSGVSLKDIVCIYCSLIRSILEYGCAVWHPGLTVSQSKDIERIQKRCLRIIYHDLSYQEALVQSGLESLSSRRETIIRNLFNELKNTNHVLHYLLPERQQLVNIRQSYSFQLPLCRTIRGRRDFISYCLFKRY